VVAQPPTFAEPSRYAPTDVERAELERGLASLVERIEPLRRRHTALAGRAGDALADVAVYSKAVEWLLRHDEFFTADYVGMARHALETGLQRAAALAGDERPWAEATRAVIRGYFSKVDGSVQPYAVSAPAQSPAAGRSRLDVILHGRDATLNEVKFIHTHDGKPADDDAAGLVLHVFGRTNNAYRWAGETDVFEAIEAVKRNYPVDERRIVLRGFSMGGAGAWHLGLHHPSLWCSVEAGAGFTETRQYLGRQAWTDVELKGLRIYDAVDYARNALHVPVAAYGGELDKQLQASVNIREALAALGVAFQVDGQSARGTGLDFLHVVGARTGHSVDPASARILKLFRDEHAAAGLDSIPAQVRFVTYTLKYNRSSWVSVERLEAHYKQASVDATIDPGDSVTVRCENVAIIGVDRRAGESIRLGDQVFPLRSAVKGLLPEVYFSKAEDRWTALDYDQSRALQENARRAKRPGLQGPIDDAFAGDFLCVRGTGRPWNPRVQAWADLRLNQFAALWDKRLRGRLRIKTDSEVTAEDIERSHVVLFGDPGSNLLIERMLPDLPLSWTRAELRLAGTFPASDHVPVLIAVNPQNPLKYVVLNSGHTFGGDAFAGTNALLYPRLGDYAVIRVGAGPDDMKVSGYFDEDWKLPARKEAAG
jgi:hypothetical protein